MTHWTVVTEYVACVYVLVLFSGMIGNRRVNMQTSRMFWFSLCVTVLDILINLLSVYLLRYAVNVPRNALVGVNALYFIVTMIMTTCIMLNINALMFEDRVDEPAYECINGLLLALLTAGLIIVAIALNRGWLFSVDAEGGYTRGPLIWFPYWFMAANTAVLLAGFLRERNRVRPAFIRVGLLLPPMVIAVSVLQFFYPDALLSGTLAAIVLTVLFIYGQQQNLHIDHLTTLASREMFYKTLEHFVQRKTLFHVIIVSLRDYKTLNTRLGQRVGDEYLRLVGVWLAGLNKRAVTCRFSGVEFALIVPEEPQIPDYETLFAALQERFAKPWTCESKTVTNESKTVMLRAAIADIAYPEHASSVNQLITFLEYAVRLAKSGKGNHVMRFDKQMRSRIGRRNYVIAQLEQALSRERCFVEYQPIYDCARGRFVGAEALARIRDDGERVIMPGEFIPLSEEAGLVHMVDRAVLEQACRFLSSHREAGLDWISVNTTGMEYQDPAAREWLYELLARYDLPAGCLHLELTERMFMENLEGVCEACSALRAHGVGISMDDFGIGYSNLFNAVRLPLDCVKIDKSFVDHIVADARARDVLQTIAAGLKALGVPLIAEGVETEEQQKIVEHVGIPLVQGFYHARPLGEEALLKTIGQRGQACFDSRSKLQQRA